jgi:hypothetical protein
MRAWRWSLGGATVALLLVALSTPPETRADDSQPYITISVNDPKRRGQEVTVVTQLKVNADFVPADLVRLTVVVESRKSGRRWYLFDGQVHRLATNTSTWVISLNPSDDECYVVATERSGSGQVIARNERRIRIG